MSVNTQNASAANSRDTAVTSGSTPFSFGSNDGLAKMLAIAAALRQRKTSPDENLKKEIKNSAFPSANAAAKNVQVSKLTKREQVLNAPQDKPSE